MLRLENRGVGEDQVTHASDSREIDDAMESGKHAVTRSVDDLLGSCVDGPLGLLGGEERKHGEQSVTAAVGATL